MVFPFLITIPFPSNDISSFDGRIPAVYRRHSMALTGAARIDEAFSISRTADSIE